MGDCLVDERLVAAHLVDDDVVLLPEVIVLAVILPEQNDDQCRQHRYDADQQEDDCGCLHRSVSDKKFTGAKLAKTLRPYNSADRFTSVFRQIYECFR